jgi:hypothetical protein
MHFLYQIDYPLFLHTFSAKASPLEYAYYLSDYIAGELQRLAAESTLHDKWLNFEVIRRLSIRAEKSDEILDVRGTAGALRRIWLAEPGFLYQTAAYFNRNNFVKEAMGEFLSTAENIDFTVFLSNSYPIRQTALDLEARNVLLKQFARSSTDVRLEAFLRTAYGLWEQYFQSSVTTGNFSSDDFLLTDYRDFVVNYYNLLVSNQDLVASMYAVITMLDQLDSEWAASIYQQTARFKLYHSHLYLMSCSCKNRGLHDAGLLRAYDQLTAQPIQQARYGSEIIQRHFATAKKNPTN